MSLLLLLEQLVEALLQQILTLLLEELARRGLQRIAEQFAEIGRCQRRCVERAAETGEQRAVADLWKTEVWELARFLNRDRERIPVRSIEKPPSAELRPGQFDTDSLPPYPDLDPVLRCLVEEELSVEATGMPVVHRYKEQ